MDKVIISQDSLSSFVNDLSPNAFRNLTKVDFGAMDKTRVKPLGVYGSKSEIVRLFKSQGVIDERT